MKHIIGENYLCFYSLMEMILDDLGYVEWNQFSLANQFGVVLPNNYVISGVKNVKISNDERMYGAHIDCRKINEFMETFKIPLKVSYIPSNPYGEYEIDKQYLTDNYCIYTYSYGSLYGKNDKWQVGHASLFLKYINDDEIEMYDPGPIGAGKKNVKLYQLYEAIYDVRGGFYIFEKLDKNMNRCFFSRKGECRAKCKYCFGKWNTYIKFADTENIKDNTIIYPNCDGDAFDVNWRDLIKKIRNLPAKNIVVSISTKFNLDDKIINDIAKLDQILQRKKGMLKISVSFSCEQSIPVIEKNTATYAERINLVKKITEKNIPYFTVIKPVLPFIDFNEYKKIIDDTIALSPYYVIGDLYVNTESYFFHEYIENMNYRMEQKNVSWNGENGEWMVVRNDKLRNEIKKYIMQLGGRVFESDKDAIIYVRTQRSNWNE